MTSQPASAPSPGRASQPAPLPSLTGLRWLAAAMVFVYHVRNLGFFGDGVGQWLSDRFVAGDSGVSFFFILSGFVLAWSSRGEKATHFWWNRFARIYPVHFLTAMIALVLAATLLPAFVPSSPGEAIANIFLVSDWNAAWWQALNPVSWSLVCEAFFYLTFPFTLLLLRRLAPQWLLVVAVAALAVSIGFVALAVNHLVPWMGYSFPLARLPEFVLGVALGQFARVSRWRGPNLPISLGIAAVAIIGASWLPHDWAFTITMVPYALVISAAARTNIDGRRSFFDHEILQRLGRVSFSFYMIHLMVMRTIEAIVVRQPRFAWPQGLLYTVGVFTLALLAANVVYFICERPAQRALRPLFRPASPTPVL